MLPRMIWLISTTSPLATESPSVAAIARGVPANNPPLEFPGAAAPGAAAPGAAAPCASTPVSCMQSPIALLTWLLIVGLKTVNSGRTQHGAVEASVSTTEVVIGDAEVRVGLCGCALAVRSAGWCKCTPRNHMAGVHYNIGG